MRPEIGETITGVSEIDAGRLHHRFPILDIGLGLFQRGIGIIEVLLADRFVGQRLLVAVRPRPKGRQIGLSPAQGGLGIVERRLKGGGIDLIELLTGLDIGTFREQAFLNEPVDLGPDFRNPKRGRPSRQFGGDRNAFWFHDNHSHFGGIALWRSTRALLFSATGQRQTDDENSSDDDKPMSVPTQ